MFMVTSRRHGRAQRQGREGAEKERPPDMFTKRPLVFTPECGYRPNLFRYSSEEMKTAGV
jgi:hypothetical protein